LPTLQVAETHPFSQPLDRRNRPLLLPLEHQIPFPTLHSAETHLLSHPSGKITPLFPSIRQQRRASSPTLQAAETPYSPFLSGNRRTPFSHLLSSRDLSLLPHFSHAAETSPFAHPSGRKITPLLPHTTSPTIQATETLPILPPFRQQRHYQFSHPSGSRDRPLCPPFRQQRRTLSPILQAENSHPFSHRSGSRDPPLIPSFRKQRHTFLSPS
jgi:hypothetical protein